MMILLTISACAGTQEVNVSAKPVEKPTLELPKADRLSMRDIKWKIITPENQKQVFQDLNESGKDVVLFGLTDQGYERLSLNLSDLRAYIQQQQAIIAAYESYQSRANESIEEANKRMKNMEKQLQENKPQENEGSFFDLNPFW